MVLFFSGAWRAASTRTSSGLGDTWWSTWGHWTPDNHPTPSTAHVLVLWPRGRLQPSIAQRPSTPIGRQKDTAVLGLLDSI